MTDGLEYAWLFVVVMGVIYVLVTRALKRLRVVRRMQLAGLTRRREAERTFAERSADIRGALGRGFEVLGVLMPLGEDDRQKIGTSLRRAGFSDPGTLTVVLGVKAGCLLVGFVVGVGVSVWYLFGFVGLVAGIVGGVLLGVVLNLVPEMVLAAVGARRLSRIQAALPEAFDLLIVCLESGLTFERSLQRTVRDLRWFRPPLAEELGVASVDLSVHGRTRADALGRLAARLDSQDFRDLAMVVSQSERHGTPLADSLRKLAASLRVEAISRMQAKMARLPVLLVLPTIAFVLPGIIVLAAGPSLAQLGEQLGSFGS